MTMTSIAQLIIGVTDLAAALLFLYGLKRMSSPVTAPSGIFVAGSIHTDRGGLWSDCADWQLGIAPGVHPSSGMG